MTTPATAKVAVAIPTLLGGQALANCLLSLDRQTWQNFEVIVIDNGAHSKQSDVYHLALNFRLVVLRPPANIGYAAAVNLATRNTTATMIAALNDDTEAEPRWLEELVREMESGSRVGICASRIRLIGSDFLDSAGMSICLDGSSKQRGRLALPESFDRSENILLASGCAALYRRELLDEIGGFDGDFFLYCEDTDLGLRALWAGWQCRYAPRACVWHHYSHTVQPYSRLKATYVERNRLWVALKNFPLPLLLIVPFVSAVRYFFQLWQTLRGEGAAAQFSRSGYSLGSAVGIVLGAHFKTLQNIPALLAKRAEIRRTRRIDSAEFIRQIMRYRMTVWDLARGC